MSCWKWGCAETWASAAVCGPPRAPSRTSAIHSVLRTAMLPERASGAWRQRCRQSEAGQRDARRPLRRPLFMGLAWLPPRAQGRPTGGS